MMSRTQITLEPEIQRRARQRANDLGVSLAEYLRRLVARGLGSPQTTVDPAWVFDLGSSGGSALMSRMTKTEWSLTFFIPRIGNLRADNSGQP